MSKLCSCLYKVCSFRSQTFVSVWESVTIKQQLWIWCSIETCLGTAGSCFLCFVAADQHIWVKEGRIWISWVCRGSRLVCSAEADGEIQILFHSHLSMQVWTIKTWTAADLFEACWPFLDPPNSLCPSWSSCWRAAIFSWNEGGRSQSSVTIWPWHSIICHT